MLEEANQATTQKKIDNSSDASDRGRFDLEHETRQDNSPDVNKDIQTPCPPGFCLAVNSTLRSVAVLARTCAVDCQ